MDQDNERRLTTRDQLTDFLLYTAPGGQVKVECILHDETIWLPQKRIAELFGVGIPAISKHIANIFESGELDESSVISILETTAADGKNYQTKFISVPYESAIMQENNEEMKPMGCGDKKTTISRRGAETQSNS
jgi:hypothetical protein